jgi:alkanesulfonate monooxygenase SsuD/methylene tetrahydromethanopterin reductase-like flavin-dependent oxidoreductase (luciferase family)
MLFDYFILMTSRPHTPYCEVLDWVTEQAQLAEETGSNTFWLTEHHFGGEGWDIQPNPIMTCMHLAPRVRHIRLGIAALILPEWHPLRLAEDVAILDHSVKGRLELGIAKGITNREISNLNAFEVDRRFPGANEAIFLEDLDILRKAWTEEPFTYLGEYYQFPRPGVLDSGAALLGGKPAGSEYTGMSIVPTPYQRPHPPLWMVGDTDGTFRMAAQNGCKAITWLRSRQALRQIFETYRATASAVQGRELALGEDTALLRFCYVAQTREEARQIAEPCVNALYGGYLGGLRPGRGIYAEPGEKLSAAEEAKPWFDFLYERGHLFVGTPDDVCEQIRDMQEWVGLGRLLAWTWLPGLSMQETIPAMKLFGKEVIPNFA